MSFTKTLWRDNNTPAITAAQLNRIEQGIEDAHTDIQSLESDVEELQQNAAARELVQAETERATLAEQSLSGDITAETTRATTAEQNISQNFTSLLNAHAQDNSTQFNSVQGSLDTLTAQLGEAVSDGYVEDGVAYFVNSSGEILFSITGIGGGGGGGGTNDAKITVSNTSGWSTKTISEGGSCIITMSWSSVLDNIPTGPGILTVTVNSNVKSVLNVEQGNISVNVSSYLTTGSNTIRMKVTDTYGNERTLNYTVSVVALSITSSFDPSTPVTGAFDFSYIPVGNVEKTVYIEIDGVVVGTQTVTSSGRQQTFTVSAQTHGDHTLKAYFTATIGSELVRSNELYYAFIALVDGNTTPIIASDFNTTTVEQYTSLSINYTVYNPSSLTSEINLVENSTVLSTLTVDRTKQTWVYRPDVTGNLTLRIQCGGVVKSFALTVTESSIDIEAETADLALYLSSYGRSNNEEHPGTWTYGNITSTFTGFNYVSNGWLLDNEGTTVLSVNGGASVVIGYKPFAQDFRTTGKTIGIEFSTTDVLNYDATIISCMNGGRGIEVTPQTITLKSEQSSISMQYKENEHNSVYFVIEKRSENRLMYCYINGIISGVIQYPENDDFSQTTPANITIGSNLCNTNIYNIRIYDNDLTRYQVLNNWIADTRNIDDMLARYNRNNIYDEYGNVVIAKLPSNLPYMIITCPQLPQYKGDKKTSAIQYVDPVTASNSYTATGVQSDVQGTSSQYYARKNYKLKYKNGFIIDNEEVQTYKLRNTSIPTSTFTMKADVASSEGANNVELARLYNDICPYRTPAQVQNANVRQGIDGFPIVMFWNDGTNTSFLGKYNFNNDKGTEEVFGFVTGDESWEIKNNTSDRVLWKSDDYTGSDWLNDFEARYPDTDPPFENPAQLSEFATWVKSTDTTAATNNALSESVTYDGVTYTTDSAEYRLAKFKAEAGNYMELNSAIFYYIFTELFLMVDSRAKNAFPSFIGGAING